MPGDQWVLLSHLENDSSCPHWLLDFPYFNGIPPMHMYACVYVCA